MKALSIRSPWWWYILHGGKDIENRSWVTAHRGRILIHASSWFEPVEILDACIVAQRAYRRASGCAYGQEVRPSLAELKADSGAFVGSVDLVGAVRDHHSSPWFFGPCGLVLANPIVFDDPIPAKGRLSLFDVDPAILAMLPEGSALHV